MRALRAAIITCGALVAGGAIGAVASAEGGGVGVLLAAVAGLLALPAVLRRALQVRDARVASLGRAEDARPPVEGRNAARLCFYAGSLTITFATWRPALGLTVSEMLFMLAFAGAVFDAIRGRPLAPVPRAVLLGALTFAVGGAISSAGSQDPSSSLAQTLQGVYVMLLWAWTGAMVLRAAGQVRTAVSLWVVSAALSGIAAIAQLAGVHVLLTAVTGDRMTAFTDHPNDLGGAAAIALVPALAVAHERFGRGRTAHGVLWSAGSAAILTGMILSGSVTAFGAAFLATVVWMASPRVRTGARVAVVTVVAVALVAATVAGGRISPLERVQEVVSSPLQKAGGGSGEVRLKVVRNAWPRIAADPFVGVGLDLQSSVVPTIEQNGVVTSSQIHGLPVAAWYEGGILALAGLVLVFGGLLRTTLSTDAGDDPLTGWTLSAALVGSILFLLTAPMDFQQYAWMPAVLLVGWWAHQPRAAWALARREAPAGLADRAARPLGAREHVA